MDKFKIGDKVEVVEKYNEYKVGEVGIITSINHTYCRINGDTWGAPGRYFKKVEDIIYEDQWHLNDGKVEIPGDADKLEKDGSVVAFRYRKVKPFEFGDRVKSSGNGFVEYIFICYNWKDENLCTVASNSGVYEYQPVHLFTKI